MALKLNANRKVMGVMRGFGASNAGPRPRAASNRLTPAAAHEDQFMNVVLEDADEVVSDNEVRRLGMIVIRGSSILQLECVEG